MGRELETVEPKEVRLEGIRDEFRVALQSEIEAARRGESSSAVQLLNGRRIAQIGRNYQYLFQIESVLNLPGDVPGDLYVPDRAPLEVVVISVEGLSITVSVPDDLGRFVPSARLQSNLAHLMRKLIERIEALGNKPNPVGDRIMGAKVSGSPGPDKLPNERCNLEQRRAVASSLGRNMTFIWGPPGTGKSRTIGAIGEHLYLRGRSVLLVSHTNIAVDQALLHIGEALRAELTQGKVLRVGEPKDRRMIFEWKDLLMEEHVKRRSAELTERRVGLSAEREAAIARIKEVTRNIDICEWVDEAREDIANMAQNLCEVRRLEDDVDQARAEQSRLRDSSEYWARATESARLAQEQHEQMKKLDDDIEGMLLRKKYIQTELATRKIYLAGAAKLLAQAVRGEPMRSRAQVLPSVEEQASRVDQAQAKAAETRKVWEELTARLAEDKKLYTETSSMSKLIRLWRRLPSPEEQLKIIENVQGQLSVASKRQESAEAILKTSTELLVEIKHLAEELQAFADVPDYKTQNGIFTKKQNEVQKLRKKSDWLERTLAETKAARAKLAAALESFNHEYSSSPLDVLREAKAHAAKLTEISPRTDDLTRQWAKCRCELEEMLKIRLGALRQWGLTEQAPSSPEPMFDAIRDAYHRAAAEVQVLQLNELREERKHLNDHIRALETEIEKINQMLERVEELVIADATIIATTLTRAYLRDSIQSRRFDTVIIDEASMAPIPSLWVAAGLADANAVVVGDFRQLPPIVISKHELAEKWLGRDIFEVAGLTKPNTFPPYVIPLKRQYRMHPDISAIPSTLIYEGLEDDPSTKTEGDKTLSDWYCFDWGHDDAVLLVDTGSVGAWVTSVPRGRYMSSRLNFLSATISVDLCQKLLREGRTEWKEGDPARILIVCPYRPHANLLRLLLDANGLFGEVLSGTAHSFQGSEADVVIFDLVNDEPHWRVAMFMPDHDKNMKQLLNVALTRAKRRLFMVGDFDYIAKRAKKAFIGAKLVPFLRDRYPKANAIDVIPPKLSARAAKAQALALGDGEIVPHAARLLATQDQFYSLLRQDFGQARKRIVIYSAFITQNGLARLEPQLRAAVERGIQCYVITKAHSDRNKSELANYRMLEQGLTGWGVIVIHKRRMHEKLVFVDDDVIWSGSLNPLSFQDTQEVMERRVSRDVVEHYARVLRLNDLVGEYTPGPPSCPNCGSEVVASEGRDKPFYWRCIRKDCYGRDIDEAPPQEGGIIVCRNCGGRLEFGQWGGAPAWRCVEKRRHHQKVARTHLRLLKMREIIPERELRRLDGQFKITPQNQSKKVDRTGQQFFQSMG